MNKNKLVDELKSSKKFIRANASDTTPEKAEEIQSLLSSAIEAAQDSDIDSVLESLDAIDSEAVPDWNITEHAREYCE